MNATVVSVITFDPWPFAESAVQLVSDIPIYRHGIPLYHAYGGTWELNTQDDQLALLDNGSLAVGGFDHNRFTVGMTVELPQEE